MSLRESDANLNGKSSGLEMHPIQPFSALDQTPEPAEKQSKINHADNLQDAVQRGND